MILQTPSTVGEPQIISGGRRICAEEILPGRNLFWNMEEILPAFGVSFVKYFLLKTEYA